MDQMRKGDSHLVQDMRRNLIAVKLQKMQVTIKYYQNKP